MNCGLLIHPWRNMWGSDKVADHVRCDETVWNEITEHMADVKANMLVVDLDGALAYPSHPEVAAPDKWGGGDGNRGKYLDAVDQLAGARGMVERHFAKIG